MDDIAFFNFDKHKGKKLTDEKEHCKWILYYKAGVLLSGLQPANNQQMSMLDKRDRFKLERVTQAVDKINQKSGTDTIIYATMGTTNAWKQNQNYKSSNFVESDKLAIELKRSVGFL